MALLMQACARRELLEGRGMDQRMAMTARQCARFEITSAGGGPPARSDETREDVAARARMGGNLELFAGRLIPEKQVTLGVAAMALAVRRIKGLRGIFLGDGPERAALDAAIAEHGLEDVVSAPGFAETETVEAELRRALCVLLPSRREGYGLVVVEAAARATPSVVVAGEDNAAPEWKDLLRDLDRKRFFQVGPDDVLDRRADEGRPSGHEMEKGRAE